MKKSFIIIAIISALISSYFIYDKQAYHKVHKIITPTQILIDINNNFILDENKPIIINDINYLSNDNSINISPEKRLIIDYYTNKTTEYLLKNKFVKIKNNEIFIKNKKYKDLLLTSPYFYDNTKTHKDKFIKYINTINENDYILFNTHSATYHKLNCKYGAKSKKYKIIRTTTFPQNAKLCNCIKENNTKIENNLSYTDIKKQFKKNNITVFFIDLNEIYKPSKTCNTNACKALLNEINNAKETIDFALYGLKHQPNIVTALINAKNRGVKIRFVCDFNKNTNENYEEIEKLKKHFPNNSDEEYEKSNKSAIMHNKFFIFDKKKVFTGSSNITQTDITGFNSNTVLLINSKEIAQIYTNEFEQMFNGAFHYFKKSNAENLTNINGTKISIYFSPQDKALTTKIIPLIEKAQNKIYISTFFLTNHQLKTALIKAKKRNVEVKIINDATNASNKYNINKELRDNKIRVKTENFAGKNHSKNIIIDNNISIIGSMNFTNSGDRRNDENIVIIEDTDINKYLTNIFKYLWNRIPQKYETIDPKPESIDSIGSCYDGIDNDFDDLIDKEDYSCKAN